MSHESRMKRSNHERREVQMGQQPAGPSVSVEAVVPAPVGESEPDLASLPEVLSQPPKPSGIVCKCGATNWMVWKTRRFVGRIERTRICMNVLLGGKTCGRYLKTVERAVGGCGEVPA